MQGVWTGKGAVPRHGGQGFYHLRTLPTSKYLRYLLLTHPAARSFTIPLITTSESKGSQHVDGRQQGGGTSCPRIANCLYLKDSLVSCRRPALVSRGTLSVLFPVTSMCALRDERIGGPFPTLPLPPLSPYINRRSLRLPRLHCSERPSVTRECTG